MQPHIMAFNCYTFGYFRLLAGGLLAAASSVLPWASEAWRVSAPGAKLGLRFAVWMPKQHLEPCFAGTHGWVAIAQSAPDSLTHQP